LRFAELSLKEKQRKAKHHQHISALAQQACLAAGYYANFTVISWGCLKLLPYSAVVAREAEFELSERLLQDKESAGMVRRESNMVTLDVFADSQCCAWRLS